MQLPCVVIQLLPWSRILGHIFIGQQSFAFAVAECVCDKSNINVHGCAAAYQCVNAQGSSMHTPQPASTHHCHCVVYAIHIVGAFDHAVCDQFASVISQQSKKITVQITGFIAGPKPLCCVILAGQMCPHLGIKLTESRVGPSIDDYGLLHELFNADH